MNPVVLIKKKRAGHELSKDELSFLVHGFTSGAIPDYQISAFLMAVCFQSMTPAETAHFVSLLQHSGKVLELNLGVPKVDKHSTGGIGDKTTLILAPLLASCGFAYPTIAGRGLAHTGGTVDKLDSIPGFNSSISLKRFEELVASVGLAFMAQTDEVCPADKKLYALRDVTGTVESTPLIVASIMSKKFAEGIDGILFDVKCGSGAFMKTEKDARSLAKALVATARAGKKKAAALVTDMSEPLGKGVGNAIEVNECVAFLRQGPQDAPPEPRLREITLKLAEEIFVLGEQARGKRTQDRKAIRRELEEALASGKAYSKFLEIVSLQGGDTAAIDHGLPLAPVKTALRAVRSGTISAMNAEEIGLALIELGGGRHTASDTVDGSVGFWFEKHVGSKVKKGDAICFIYASSKETADIADKMLTNAIQISTKPAKKTKLIRSKI